jgi:hypothetical protein
MRYSRSEGLKPFVSGDPVAIDFGPGRPYRLGRVGKVMKNGNFRLEGSDQQYRQNGDSTGESFSGHAVVHLTPAVEAEQKVRLRLARHARRCRDLGEAFRRPDLVDPRLTEMIAELVREWAIRGEPTA